jgi:hypothetical protein
MQRPSYEPFDSQQNHNAPPSYGNLSGVGGGGYSQQHFGQHNAPAAFVSRFDVDQSGMISLQSVQKNLNNFELFDKIPLNTLTPPPCPIPFCS